MKIEEKTFTNTVRYKMFDVGELIVPVSPRAPLCAGPYKVVRCLPPDCVDDEAIVFVEGHKFGMTSEYYGPYVEKKEDPAP